MRMTNGWNDQTGESTNKGAVHLGMRYPSNPLAMTTRWIWLVPS